MKTILLSIVLGLIPCLMLSGCATYSVKFRNGRDGDVTEISDTVPFFMKRDLSAANAKFKWSKNGGEWTLGADVHNTDGTPALDALGSLEQIVGLIVAAKSSQREQAYANTTEQFTPLPDGSNPAKRCRQFVRCPRCSILTRIP